MATKRLRVTVEGKVYDVLVELLDEQGSPAPAGGAAAPLPAAPLPAVSAPPPAAVAAPAGAAAPAGPGDIVAPLGGKVVSIDVKIGQDVDETTQVATIEAMKMNTYVYAPRAGRVAGIVASPGEGVEEGAVLLRLA